MRSDDEMNQLRNTAVKAILRVGTNAIGTWSLWKDK